MHEQSWLVFGVLECYAASDIQWMAENVEDYPASSGYQTFADSVNDVKVGLTARNQACPRLCRRSSRRGTSASLAAGRRMEPFQEP